MEKIKANGIELCYESIGEGPPILLIMGVGAQLIHWPDAFCQHLAGHGYRVIRYDNRDIGQSTYFDEAGVPDVRWAALRAYARFPKRPPYSLNDMAQDGVALLDELGLEDAHVVGASMGGMIAQWLAIDHPTRARSLTSIMSTTGSRKFKPKTKALMALIGPPARTADQAADRSVRIFEAIGSPGYEFDEGYVRDLGRRSFERGNNPAGFARQMLAILASPERTKPLARVRCPSLVIHGVEDPLIPIGAGRATAKAIPGAEIHEVEGMAHDLPKRLWESLAARIVENARRAEAGSVVG